MSVPFAQIDFHCCSSQYISGLIFTPQKRPLNGLSSTKEIYSINILQIQGDSAQYSHSFEIHASLQNNNNDSTKDSDMQMLLSDCEWKLDIGRRRKIWIVASKVE